MENLQVTYATLETAANKSAATGDAFLEQLNQLQSQVGAMVWQGGSGTAFQAHFENVRKQLATVQQQLNGLAEQIRGAARALQESDQAVANSFKS